MDSNFRNYSRCFKISASCISALILSVSLALANPESDPHDYYNDYPKLDSISLERDDRGYFIRYYNSSSSTRSDVELFLDDGTKIEVNVDTNVDKFGREKITVKIKSNSYMVWPAEPQFVQDIDEIEIRIIPPVM